MTPRLGDSLPPRLAPPRQVGRYELIEPLGSGGMGTVYRARQTQLDKWVAIKLLDARLAGRSRGVTRFLREARAAAQIRHPNVIEVFDVGIDDGAVFLAMEWLEGMDVAALLLQRGRLDLHQLIELMAPVLAGVRAAHEAGVVHRDLKPSNLFLARRGRGRVEPIVLDFGVSRLVEDELRDLTPVTEPDAMIGTAAYIAPEQARDGRLADDRSDQYSLAVIAYECATGQRPFSGRSMFELLQSIATAEVRPPSQLNPALPPTFDAVLLQALAREPAERFPDLDAFARALMGFAAPRTWMLWGEELAGDPKRAGDALDILSTAPASQPRPVPVLPANSPPARAKPYGALLAGFGAGAALAASALWAFSGAPAGARWSDTCSPEASPLSRAPSSTPVKSPPATGLTPNPHIESPLPSLGESTPRPVEGRSRSASSATQSATSVSSGSAVPPSSANSSVPSGRLAPGAFNPSSPTPARATAAPRAGRSPEARPTRRTSADVELGVNDAPILE